MRIVPGAAWGVITARGGSKSIPLKNLVPVVGRPLISYNIAAAKRAKTLERILCSTDSDKIAAVARDLGAEVAERPAHLGGDDVNSIDVLVDLAQTVGEREGRLPDIIVLLQPTSIFLTSAQIDACVQALLDNPAARSSQTVVKVPHQFHAHNQREMFDGGRDIAFVFQKERDRGYNKQTKPTYYTYGNLIVTRTAALLEEKTIFGRPSIPIVIPLYTAYDLDGPDDIEMAELMIRHRLVEVE
jgi:CMP-N-acetylneuraminic acid synthetase